MPCMTLQYLEFGRGLSNFWTSQPMRALLLQSGKQSNSEASCFIRNLSCHRPFQISPDPSSPYLELVLIGASITPLVRRPQLLGFLEWPAAIYFSIDARLYWTRWLTAGTQEPRGIMQPKNARIDQPFLRRVAPAAGGCVLSPETVSGLCKNPPKPKENFSASCLCCGHVCQR